MIIKTVEEVREYVQKDYWQGGVSKGKSGYENFSIDWGWNGKLVHCLNEAMPLRNKRILDLGCAYGQVVAALLKNGYNAWGCDLSDYAIEAGIKQYPQMKDKIRQCSGHDLSCYKEETFDFIYSQQVFEHIPADVCDALAKETYRVARPRAIMWVGLVLDISSDFQPQGYNPEDPDKTHINLRPKIWWDEKMTKAGWKIEKAFDKKFRGTTAPNGYSFFNEYGWHSICYSK